MQNIWETRESEFINMWFLRRYLGTWKPGFILHTGISDTKVVARATLESNFCTALSGEIIWSKCCLSSPQLFLQKTARFYWLSSMACEFCSPRSMKTSSFGSFISLLMTKKQKKTERETSVTHTATLDFVVSLKQRGRVQLNCF